MMIMVIMIVMMMIIMMMQQDLQCAMANTLSSVGCLTSHQHTS